MPPDGLTNTSSFCTPVPAFENAIQCPRSQGAWLRFSFREILERSLGRLFVYNDTTNSTSTIIPWLPEQLTYPNGYLVVLRANQTYRLRFETSVVRIFHQSTRISNLIVFRPLMLCDILV